MDEHLERYEKYARGVKRIALLAGLWPGRASSKLLRLVVIVQCLASIITTCGIMYLVISHITNIPLLTKSFGIAVGFCTMLVKVSAFSIYRDRLVKTHETLEKKFSSDLANLNYRPVLLSMIENFDRPTTWFSLTSLGVIVMYNLTPIILIIIQLSRGVEVLQFRTIFPSKYPFPQSGILFVVCYVIEVVGSYAIGMISTCTDVLFGFYVFQMVGQLRVLGYRMRNLTSSDDHLSVIKECVLRQEILTECRDQLQTIYGPIVLWLLTSSAIIICANVFHVSQISLDNFLLSLSIVIYIFMKLMQTMLYGWCGLFLIAESEVFHEAIYSSGWPGCGDKIFLSNVHMMLLGKPFVLKACHFYPITLDIVTGIVNTAVSYFFLLRTLEEK